MNYDTYWLSAYAGSKKRFAKTLGKSMQCGISVTCEVREETRSPAHCSIPRNDVIRYESPAPRIYFCIFESPTTKTFKKDRKNNSSMKQEMVQIPKKEYKELLEEIGILRNQKMMESIKESDEAKRKGVKTWELKTHS